MDKLSRLGDESLALLFREVQARDPGAGPAGAMPRKSALEILQAEAAQLAPPHRDRFGRLIESVRSQAGRGSSTPVTTQTAGVAGAGRPLDQATRDYFEPRFGVDFSQVRIHDDREAHREAARVNARAFTVDEHIVFADGQAAPETAAGQQLLAHELVHVAQQAVAPAPSRGVSRPSDPAEREADSAAGRVVAGMRVSVMAAPSASVQCTQVDAAPAVASSERVRYQPGERKASFSLSPDIDRFGDYGFVLSGFAVDQAQLKRDHVEFLRLLVSGFGLDRDPPGAHIRLIEGHTDLVDTESINEPLRRARADAVVQLLTQELHVPTTNVDLVRGAPPGSPLAKNATPQDRAHNRAVVIELEPLRAPTAKHAALHVSTRWSLQSVASASAGAILGAGGGLFLLKDLSSGESREIFFYGAGLAGGIGLRKLPPRVTAALPSPTEFTTTVPHTFEQFAGPGTIDILSGDIIAAGYSLGYAHFSSIRSTDNKGIWIGGFEAGGLGLTGAILVGRWKLATH
jgi:outer membrane protein OmpA-like peptidoglycan-associated protein